MFNSSYHSERQEVAVKKPRELKGRGRNEHAIKEEEVDNRKVEQHHSNEFPLIK